MARPELSVVVNMEPSAISVAASKVILELWLNAAPGRDILVKERYADDGQEIYLELVREKDEPQTETN